MSSFVATEKKNIETPSWNLDASFGYFSDLTSPVDIYSILFIFFYQKSSISAYLDQ